MTAEIPVARLDTTPALGTTDGLVFQMYYAQCLAAGTYLVAHEGWAVVVDPLRDVGQYLQALDAAGAKLKAVLLTHAHADYVGGHNELAQRTGATIVAGQHTGMTFPHLRAREGDVVTLSDAYRVRVMETPGHTLGCVTYVLEAARAPLLAFTGDALFVGSCGRPDLVGATVPATAMAGTMFRSLQRLRALGDGVMVFPAHGAGSPCGKALSDKLYSSIGHEARTNPALLHTDEAAFVEWLVGSGTMPTPPQYFGECVQSNLHGACVLSETIAKVPVMESTAFAAASAGRLVIDTREAGEFLAAHMPGSVNLCLGTHGGVVLSTVDGNFSIWLGTLVTAPEFFVVCSPGKQQEVLERMGRVGYSARVAGLTTDLGACATVTVERVDPVQAAALGAQFVDVRTPQEFRSPKQGHIEGARNVPLQGTMEEFQASAASLDPARKYVCLCSGGFRSALAASLLRRAGLDATDVFGGYDLTVRPKNPEMMVGLAVQG